MVRVLCQVMIPSAMQTVDVPQLQRWKLDAGNWYLDPADPPPSEASIMKKYYFEKLKRKRERIRVCGMCGSTKMLRTLVLP